MRMLISGLFVFFSFTTQATSLDIMYEAKRAISFDDGEKLNRLIDGGMSPDLMVDDVAYGKEGVHLLGLAAREGSLRCAEVLVKRNADVNKKNVVNENALMLASFFSDGNSNLPNAHERIVHLLVEAGADLENPQFFTPLAYAAYNDHYTIVEYLLSKGAKPDGDFVEGKDSNVPTALHMTTLNGHKYSMKVLLKAGANARITNQYGENALEIAKRHGFKNLYSYLECAIELKSGETYQEKCGHLK